MYWNQPLFFFFLVSDSTPSRARPVPYIELKALWLAVADYGNCCCIIRIETMGAVQDDEPEPAPGTDASCTRCCGSLHHGIGVCVCPSRLLRGGKATVLACPSSSSSSSSPACVWQLIGIARLYTIQLAVVIYQAQPGIWEGTSCCRKIGRQMTCRPAI